MNRRRTKHAGLTALAVCGIIALIVGYLLILFGPPVLLTVLFIAPATGATGFWPIALLIVVATVIWGALLTLFTHSR